jgi:hypothetical protein
MYGMVRTRASNLVDVIFVAYRSNGLAQALLTPGSAVVAGTRGAMALAERWRH